MPDQGPSYDNQPTLPSDSMVCAPSVVFIAVSCEVALYFHVWHFVVFWMACALDCRYFLLFDMLNV